MHCLLIKNWLPVASCNSKSKFDQNCARRFAYFVQEQMQLSLAWGTIKAQREMFVDFITLSSIHSVFSWSHTAKLIHSHDNLLSRDDNTVDLIYLHKWPAASTSNLNMCSGSKPPYPWTRGPGSKNSWCTSCLCENIPWNNLLNKVWLFFVWKVRNIYMNSMIYKFM
jgi:hypothetical protein